MNEAKPDIEMSRGRSETEHQYPHPPEAERSGCEVKALVKSALVGLGLFDEQRRGKTLEYLEIDL